MNFKLTKQGDWAKVRHIMGYKLPELVPYITEKIDEYGEIALEIIQGHIENQSLPWTPLSEETIRIKGHSKIYIETGVLSNGLEVKRIDNGKNELFIGFSNETTHESGLSYGQLMVMLEYGTIHAPPRPLIRPSFDEVKRIITHDLIPLIDQYMRG